MLALSSCESETQHKKHVNAIYRFELAYEKTNNVVFKQVQHKLLCNVTEDD